MTILTVLSSSAALGMMWTQGWFRRSTVLIKIADLGQRVARISQDVNAIHKRIAHVNDALTRLETSPIVPISALRINTVVVGPQEWSDLIQTLNRRNTDDQVPPMAEPTVSRILRQLVGGRREIPAANGVADMITPYHLIEIKQFRYWQKAVSQLRRYRKAFPDRKPVLCCFGRRPSLSSLELLYRTCVNEGIALVDFADLVQDVRVEVRDDPLPSREIFLQQAVEAFKSRPGWLMRSSRTSFISYLGEIYPPAALLIETPLGHAARMEDLLCYFWRKLSKGEWNCERVREIDMLFESGYCRPIDMCLDVKRALRAQLKSPGNDSWCLSEDDATSTTDDKNP